MKVVRINRSSAFPSHKYLLLGHVNKDRQSLGHEARPGTRHPAPKLPVAFQTSQTSQTRQARQPIALTPGAPSRVLRARRTPALSPAAAGRGLGGLNHTMVDWEPALGSGGPSASVSLLQMGSRILYCSLPMLRTFQVLWLHSHRRLQLSTLGLSHECAESVMWLCHPEIYPQRGKTLLCLL